MKDRQQDLHMKWEKKKKTKNTGAKQQGDKSGEDISTVWEEERKQTRQKSRSTQRYHIWEPETRKVTGDRRVRVEIGDLKESSENHYPRA